MSADPNKNHPEYGLEQQLENVVKSAAGSDYQELVYVLAQITRQLARIADATESWNRPPWEEPPAADALARKQS